MDPSNWVCRRRIGWILRAVVGLRKLSELSSSMAILHSILEDKDDFERLYAVPLKCLREQAECRALLASLDNRNDSILTWRVRSCLAISWFNPIALRSSSSEAYSLISPPQPSTARDRVARLRHLPPSFFPRISGRRPCTYLNYRARSVNALAPSLGQYSRQVRCYPQSRLA